MHHIRAIRIIEQGAQLRLSVMLLGLLACVAALLLSLPAFANAPHFNILLEDVEAAVADALAREQVAEHPKVTISSSRKKVLYSAYRPIYVDITTLTYDDKKSTWSANLIIKDDRKILNAMPLAGHYKAQGYLPVITRRLRHGDVINEDDISMELFPESDIRKDTILSVEAMLGKTPRRGIARGRPVRMSELVNPTVMDKGSMVTMLYNTPSMRISTTGESLEEGAIGDYIRVRNDTSNQVVRARITSNQEVVVGPYTEPLRARR